MAFATYQDLEDRLRVTFTATEQVQATALLDAATAVIKAEADQTIDQVVGDAVVLDGTGTRILLLSELPVTAVASVTVDGVALTFDDDYQWNANGVLVRVDGAVWPREARVVAVTYTHGYPVTPPALEAICVGMAARAWSTPAGAVRQESIGSYSVTYDTGSETTSGLSLTDSEQRIVAQYAARELIVA